MKPEIKRIFEIGIIKKEEEHFTIDCQELKEYDIEQYELLTENPKLFMQDCKDCEKVLFETNFEFKLINLNEESQISKLRAEQLGNLLKVSGIISRTTKIMSYIKETKYRCNHCGTILSIFEESVIQYPVCSCESKSTTKIKEVMENIQEIILEESVDDLDGKQPQNIRVILISSLTDDKLSGALQPGSRVEVIGIVGKTPIEKKNKTARNLFEFGLDAMSIRSLEEEFDTEITEEEMLQINDIAVNKPLKQLSESLSPSIFGYDSEKKSLVLQMVGGVKKKMANGTISRDRIHILICGAPGVSKTQLLKSVMLRCPKGLYTSGENMTKAGLTATVEQDKLTGTWALKAGPMAKCNGGVLAIDEIDKLPPEERRVLHTPMESGEIPVNKAGISATLKADCSVLAASNPKRGIFDTSGNATLVQQLDLPPALLSRFDLIWIMKDEISEEMDSEIVDIIYSQKETETHLSRELFRKYIAHAKKLEPTLPEEHKEGLKKFYNSVRQKSVSPDSDMNGMPITPRHLQGIIRMAEASAKIRLSETVSAEDIKLAQDLFLESLSAVGIDETGVIDMARIGPGKTLSKRGKMDTVLDEIKKACKEGIVFNTPELIKIMNEKGMSSDECERIIMELNMESSILKTKLGWTLFN